jgi:hypothetical protein
MEKAHAEQLGRRRAEPATPELPRAEAGRPAAAEGEMRAGGYRYPEEGQQALESRGGAGGGVGPGWEQGRRSPSVGRGKAQREGEAEGRAQGSAVLSSAGAGGRQGSSCPSDLV